jgi:hypothetical protein
VASPSVSTEVPPAVASRDGRTPEANRAPTAPHDGGPRGRSAHAVVHSSPTGLQFDARMPYETWQALGVRIAGHANSTSWWLGDWVAFGERRYRHGYRDAVVATGLDYQTLRNYGVVARRFELSRRRDNLSFQHHAEVCALTDAEQDRWLDLAAANRWSRQELRERTRAVRRADERQLSRHMLRVTVDLEREQRWRAAAASLECSFEDWVLRSLDAAASAAPGAPDDPEAGPPAA